MDIRIIHHNTNPNKDPREYNDCSMKDIVELKDMPEYLALSCDFMGRVSLQSGRIVVFLHDMPGRIDFDGYLITLHILSVEESTYLRKPYCVIPDTISQSSTLWELGECEQATLEEVGCTI